MLVSTHIAHTIAAFACHCRWLLSFLVLSFYLSSFQSRLLVLFCSIHLARGISSTYLAILHMFLHSAAVSMFSHTVLSTIADLSSCCIDLHSRAHQIRFDSLLSNTFSPYSYFISRLLFLDRLRALICSGAVLFNSTHLISCSLWPPVDPLHSYYLTKCARCSVLRSLQHHTLHPYAGQRSATLV